MPSSRFIISVVALLATCPAASAGVLTGRVLDAETGRPVTGATVHAFRQHVWTVTDREGRFRMTAAGSRFSVEVSHVGYRPEVREGLAGGNPHTFRLVPGITRLGGITVTGLREPVTPDERGPTSVLDRADLESGGRTDIAAAVATVTGVLTRDYGNFTSFALRGTDAVHTALALDGVRLNSAQNGTFDATTLPLGLADRVEVARGGGSAVYGSSPLGGVVNLITPEPDRFGVDLTAGLGSLGRRYIRFRHTGWSRPVGYVVGGNLTSARNDFGYTDLAGSTRTRANADFSDQGLFAKGTFRRGRHAFSLLGEYNAAERGDPGTLLWASDSARRSDRRGTALLRYRVRQDTNARLDARAYARRQWQNYANPGTVSDDTHDIDAAGIQVDQHVDLAGWGSATLGVEASREELASTSVSRSERTTLAAWTRVGIARAGFRLDPVLRVERLHQASRPPEGPEQRSTYLVLSPRVTLSWSIAEPLVVYAGIGRSFRAPTFNDLYWPEDQFSYGNPLLEPEWSTGADLGLTGRARDFVRYRLGFHWARLADLIQWQPDSAYRFHAVNVDSAVVRGLEVDAEFDWRGLGLRLGLDYSSAVSGSTRLIYRPALSGRAAASYARKLGAVGTRVEVGIAHTGRRFTDAANTDTLALPGHTIVRLDAGVTPRLGGLEASARFGVDNLFDVDYQTVVYYPLPGRTWYFELGFGL